MQNKKTYNFRKYCYLIISLLIILSILKAFQWIDEQLRPQVTNIAKYRVQSMISTMVNNTIREEFSQNNIDYGNLITINQNEDGDVTFLSYNSAEVNRLKAIVTSAIIDKLAELSETDIYIPIGNITGIDILKNRGPKLKFTILPMAYVDTDIESVFENTGINQVCHKIFIVINVDANAFVPNYSSSITFTTKLCVAQTIIIGSVPNNITDKVFQLTE